jgi:osmotically-inducible protein OsmY
MERLRHWLSGLTVGLALAAGAGPAAATSGPEDAKLEKQIQASLQADRDLQNNRVDVRVDGDVATLTGTVDSDAERTKSAALAEVGPIRVVDNRLKVESVGVKNAVTDSGITTSVKTRFLANETLRHQVISVETNNGVVTLKGTISSEGARRLAVDVAQHTSGVRRVDDELVPTPR